MPTQLDLSEVLHTPGMRVPFDVDMACTPEMELDCASAVTGRLVFTNTINLLVVQGNIRASLRTECPRCLTTVVSHVEAEVDEEYTVEHGQVTGHAEDDDGVADPAVKALWTAGHLLNLSELARQSLVVASPSAPLCREECRGLCPHCGRNLNEEACDCEEAPESPFAALADLLPGGGEEKGKSGAP